VKTADAHTQDVFASYENGLRKTDWLDLMIKIKQMAESEMTS